MATPVLMPKLGNSVESSIIVTWKKKLGDTVRAGDVLCEVETDKSVLEVVAPVGGVLLARYFNEGDDVPVLTNIALIGQPGESSESSPAPPNPVPAITATAATKSLEPAINAPAPKTNGHHTIEADRIAGIVSPRARTSAAKAGIDPVALTGSGPGGRVIERDIQAAASVRLLMTPSAKDQVGKSLIPPTGSGLGGRVSMRDLLASTAPISPSQNMSSAETPENDTSDIIERITLKGVRKVIAERMVASLQQTAQLTLQTAADARALQAYRKRLKASDAALGLQGVSINDLVLYATARTLLQFPAVNSTLQNMTITRYRAVHLGFAVDTPRGLLVPVIRNADKRSLRELSIEAKRLAEGAIAGSLAPDTMSGGTFTVTNLGSLGIDWFTPIINPPQVAILGVGGIALKPLEVDGEVQFIPHLALSLTIDHQAVDGAPGAKFLAALTKNIAAIDLLLAT